MLDSLGTGVTKTPAPHDAAVPRDVDVARRAVAASPPATRPGSGEAFCHSPRTSFPGSEEVTAPPHIHGRRPRHVREVECEQTCKHLSPRKDLRFGGAPVPAGNDDDEGDPGADIAGMTCTNGGIFCRATSISGSPTLEHRDHTTQAKNPGR
ncbi:hypothetical protein WMF37_26210 [Sorangium sp. So ce291]|uniref:hypothetical protein n=1 Tax=Sorangium sp. So ce291 TaxID=3133294 RepID=UPI003F62E4B1